ncbi:hypothetical protein EPI10_028810 [Gossypium australe]|uniref:Uncharacterized protein n=1 Tax=Gossypium australe TaxID=47621 RepID=A0A5B6UYD6_9ROSI|nr:hypothetical protein EPI10_028810 [Gossypium australe]
MEEGGGVERESNEEITLLAEELVQLSIKRSIVVPSEKPTLICSVWTKKYFNPDSFKAQMKSVWKSKRKFEIQTIGQCSPEFEKKDMLHAIRSTFGGVLRFEIRGDCCRLRRTYSGQSKRAGSQEIWGDSNVLHTKALGGKILSSWEDGLKVHDVDSSLREEEVLKAENYINKEAAKTSGKASWKRLARNKQDSLQLFNAERAKRKFSAEVDGEICLDTLYRVETKKIKVDGGLDLSVVREEDMFDKEAQMVVSNSLESAAANGQADRSQ